MVLWIVILFIVAAVLICYYILEGNMVKAIISVIIVLLTGVIGWFINLQLDNHAEKTTISVADEYNNDEYENAALDEYDNEMLITLFKDSLIDNSGCKFFIGKKSIRAFAIDRYNCFSLEADGKWASLWTGHQGYAQFNIETLNIQHSEGLKTLCFQIGGKSQKKISDNTVAGAATVEIYINQAPNNESTADYSYSINATETPINVEIPLEDVSTMGIRITNSAWLKDVTIVFFDIAIVSK